ncbi:MULTISPECIES: class I SAM-dependent DNA methyltransferase [unclassified Arsukibacterium]|uniref:class I SAM-dependent DNA methyltransferase n=1 Tax=unclassified Arsukibacterium TaxID=2635278 RepID=UPI000C65F8B2|nr:MULTISPECIES: class I SAM-dependent methyltransferase [unclassified Arsukibacterium]MAA94114.1 SAM-dependent methyltransferase [Rheinheimera sp.]MBM35155.1 SAM-dependent methyltransferase [Rheinheimera sp.]HAW93527.1 SAM-dependent methyltransferase [Candidatus Azambacteria bacterium]|tara:strand:- start:35621 stop:36367 length:747 start_codon:yes stop_codon:yes gene_type:complete
MLSSNALYTDLSSYYDLMCCDINYLTQSNMVHRLQQLLGNGGIKHLDLACGTGPHIRHFIDYGYQCNGLDLNQPMLDLARARCPQANFMLHDMASFTLDAPVDLITCFLYSVHYSGSINALQQCIASVSQALTPGGLFVFNAVDKNTICNQSAVRHSAQLDSSHFIFESAWHYSGEGEQQTLKLSIAKTTAAATELWQDQHPMVAVSFAQLQALLTPYFEVQILAHDYDKITPWDRSSGNAIFVCVKR